MLDQDMCFVHVHVVLMLHVQVLLDDDPGCMMFNIHHVKIFSKCQANHVLIARHVCIHQRLIEMATQSPAGRVMRNSDMTNTDLK